MKVMMKTMMKMMMKIMKTSEMEEVDTVTQEAAMVKWNRVEEAAAGIPGVNTMKKIMMTRSMRKTMMTTIMIEAEEAVTRNLAVVPAGDLAP